MKLSFYVNVPTLKDLIYQKCHIFIREVSLLGRVSCPILKKSSKQQILNEHLFGNINISVRNTPMFYSDFSRCNIKTVSDIWNIRNNTFHDEQYIHNQTTETHNWRQKYNKLKRNTPERWVDILRSYDNQTHIKPMLEINTELILFMNGKNIETNKLSSKRIINHLIDDAYKPKCQTKWEAMYN